MVRHTQTIRREAVATWSKNNFWYVVTKTSNDHKRVQRITKYQQTITNHQQTTTNHQETTKNNQTKQTISKFQLFNLFVNWKRGASWLCNLTVPLVYRDRICLLFFRFSKILSQTVIIDSKVKRDLSVYLRLEISYLLST